ncbi:unknown [Fusobacterium sp. CAG:439]|nr:unknown [Fusobacterium sp. CAG:439]
MLQALTAGKIYSTLGNNNSLVPMAIKDIANSAGLTAGSYITGDELEGKDRFLDEFGTQAIWLFGIPVYKKLMDLTMYKALKIDPDFDVRNLSKKRSKLLEKSIEYADTSIRESIIKASKNPKYTKNLAMTKFVVSTALTIASYAGLTKYRHYKTRKDAEKEILAEMAKEKQNKDTFAYTAPASTAFNNVKLKKQTSFTGSIQEFMYNPVKNLMILDGAITAERLAESRNKQELLGYTIKEGSVWLFMYFASKPIQKFLEQAAEKNKKKPASIDLDARVIESKELKEAFENGKLTESSKKVLSLKTHEELLDFIHNNPDDFVVQMAKKSDVLPVLKDAKQADNIDYRKFIDYDEFRGVAEKLTKLQNKFEEFKNANVKEKTLEAFLDNVKKLKRRSILKNMGACIGALGILAPALMIAFRKLDKNNNAFQVKEDLKKELAAKGKI